MGQSIEGINAWVNNFNQINVYIVKIVVLKNSFYSCLNFDGSRQILSILLKSKWEMENLKKNLLFSS